MSRGAYVKYKIWRRRVRNRLLVFDWFKVWWARRRLRELSPGNIRMAVDVEEDLFLLGPVVGPTLARTLADPEVHDDAKEVLVRVLTAFGDPAHLPAIRRVAEHGSPYLAPAADKQLRLFCRRLAKQGRLPEEFRTWAE